jgi:hypothetical protein
MLQRALHGVSKFISTDNPPCGQQQHICGISILYAPATRLIPLPALTIELSRNGCVWVLRESIYGVAPPSLVELQDVGFLSETPAGYFPVDARIYTTRATVSAADFLRLFDDDDGPLLRLGDVRFLPDALVSQNFTVRGGPTLYAEPGGLFRSAEGGRCDLQFAFDMCVCSNSFPLYIFSTYDATHCEIIE